jgi:hypothetical protein
MTDNNDVSPMVPNAPGWWLLDGVPREVWDSHDTCDGPPILCYTHGSGRRAYVRGIAPERWGGQLVPRADLDAARAEARAKLETVTERLGRSWYRLARVPGRPRRSPRPHRRARRGSSGRAGRARRREGPVARSRGRGEGAGPGRSSAARASRGARRQGGRAGGTSSSWACDVDGATRPSRGPPGSTARGRGHADAMAGRQVAADSDGPTALRLHATRLREKAEVT